MFNPDFFHLKIHPKFAEELNIVLSFYDYKILIESDELEKGIKRLKYTHSNSNNEDSTTIIVEKEYFTVEDFILNEVFYRKKRNLKFYPILNKKNEVANFDVSPISIIKNHQMLKQLLDNKTYKIYLITINNYGTFIRFAENKVQRLYWNPPLNAGIPLSVKKEPVAELIFMLHDFGHYLIPDLLFTGNCNDSCTTELHKHVYVNWRLLGESVTIVLNEMFIPHFFEKECNLVFNVDKPYKLFKVLLQLQKQQLQYQKFSNKKGLYWASYMYFCKQNLCEFMNLLDDTNESESSQNGKVEWKTEWDNFHARYLPISTRGREWTETNYDKLVDMKYEYQKWWKMVNKFKSEMQWRTIEEIINICSITKLDSEFEIMEKIFRYVWDTVLVFLEEKETTSEIIIDEISNLLRTKLAFKRYTLGNVHLLIKYDIKEVEIILKLLCDLDNINEQEMLEMEMNKITKMYQDCVKQLYNDKLITTNEYHNYKSIHVMIPPNILRKGDY